MSAKPGDAVTLTGTGFNTTTTNNTVFFGATKATVTTATANSITATVPFGATYAPITLLNTSTSLAAYSSANFTPSYSPSKTSITVNDFGAKVDFTTGYGPYVVAIGDLDGDGNPDLVLGNQGSISILRNTGTSAAVSTSSFSAKVDFATGSFSSVQSIAIGDLDGDGKLDLAVLTNTSTVSVFRNTATSGSITNSSFAAKVDFSTSSVPTSVAIGDLDGDGKPDLAVACNTSFSPTVSVLRNTATSGSITTGSFAARVDFATGDNPFSIVIGDLDGDGKPDLATANRNSNTISVLRNTATSGSITTSSFAAKFDFAAGTSPQSIAIGDLDGDGKADLAVANFSSNTISILRNTATSGSISTGSFATKVDFTTSDNPSAVAIGDLDGNGKPDLAVTNSYALSAVKDSTVSVFRNISTSGSITTGSFAAKVDFKTGSGPNSVAIVDLNGDGKSDLAVVNNNSATVSVLANVDVTLAPAITSFTPVTAKPGDAVTITGSRFNTTAANNIVFFGAIRATVTAATSTSLTATVPVGATYAPITLLNTGTGLAAFSRANFTPTYSPAKTGITATDFLPKQDFTTGLTSSFSSVAIGDLDGDGKPDLIVANRDAGSISVFRNTSTNGSIGTGSFAANVDFVTGSNPYSITIGDLDGDGKPDLTIANYGSNTVSVFRNTATTGSINTGSFAAKVDFSTATFVGPFPVNSGPVSVVINDLDGDGKPDLAVANSSSKTISVFLNTATSGTINTSSFAAKVDFSTGGSFSGPNSIATADFDGDGKSDLVVTNPELTAVSVFRNTAAIGNITTGSFAAKQDFTTGSSPNSIAVGDLDGDGKADLALLSGTSKVSVFRNTTTSGSISFATRVDSTVGANPSYLAIGDFDGDGKADLAVANNSSAGFNTVSILRNTATSGSISFAVKQDFSTALYPVSLAIGDLDGDGRPDLTTVTYGSTNVVSVLRNTSNNADLSALTLSAGTLSPSFASATTAYTAAVGNATSSITVTPTKADINAKITVNGAIVNSGTPSAAIALNVGANTITVADTAQNGTYKTYTIVVTRSTSLPVSITSLKAYSKFTGIEVAWTIQSELNLKNYEIEKSTNAINFSKVGNIIATGASNYSWFDVNVNSGNNFYRLKAIDNNGAYQYSQIVNEKLGGDKNIFNVLVNPIKGRMITLQLENVDKGNYSIKIFNNIGQEVASKTISHNGGSATQTIDLSKSLAAGKYNMQISNGITVIIKSIIVE